MNVTERDIYENWKKRFSYPLSPIESQASRSLRKIKKVRLVTNSKLGEMVARFDVIVLGDDASNSSHRESIRQLLKSNSGKTLWVTNRNQMQIALLKKVLKKSSLKILRVSHKKIVDENKAMHALVQKNIEHYKKIVLWTGHLRVSTRSFQNTFKDCKAFFVALQVNELRWKFQNNSGWVGIDPNFVANLDTSSLTSVDQMRAMDEKSQIVSALELKSSFYALMKIISQMMRQKKYIKPKQILSVFDQKDILISQKNELPGLIKKFLKDRMMDGESAVLPSENIVLLSTLNPSHIAEEAAHQLRIGKRGDVVFGQAGVIVEEAMAFFASRLLFPKRPIPLKQSRQGAWDDVHWTGYSLGLRLWKLWQRSVTSRNLIRKLWNTYPRNESEFKLMLAIMQDLK